MVEAELCRNRGMDEGIMTTVGLIGCPASAVVRQTISQTPSNWFKDFEDKVSKVGLWLDVLHNELNHPLALNDE